LYSCGEWSSYVFWLSPRERTGAASPIREAESAVICSIFIFDV
jgi:hypothetical protein